MQRKLRAPGPADQAAGARARPQFLVDAKLGLIVEANVEALEAWGLDQKSTPLPVAIDRAMPALQKLAGIAACRKGQSDVLGFWTARGLAQWRCNLRLADAKRRCFAIEVVGAAVDAGVSDPLPRPSCSERLAHELRTPLSAVIAYAEVLKEEHFGPIANDRYRDYARNIYDSARHALGVVDGMLGADAAKSDTSQFAFRDLDPCVIVDECLAVARPLAAEEIGRAHV